MAGALLFALPFVSLVTQRGVGICSVLFLLLALATYRQGGAMLKRHWSAVRWVVGAFAVHAAVTLALSLRPDAGGVGAEKPLRMLLALAAMLVVLACKPDRRLLWAGVIAGAMAGALLVTEQRVVQNMERPGGLINPITAGDLLVCLGLMALAATLDLRDRALAWPVLGAMAGIGGALVTGSRGSLVGLAIGLIIYTWHLRASRWARALGAGCVVLAAAIWFTPATGLQKRVGDGLREISQYHQRDLGASSMGQRMELWRAASLLIPERPLIGAGHATVRAELRAYVDQNVLDPEVLPREHFHNDVLQMLVFSGIVGLSAWLAILVAPLVFFARWLRRGASAPALAGVLVVASYFAFGLTEVIFWSMRANLFYALMVALLMGLCLNAKDQDEQ